MTKDGRPQRRIAAIHALDASSDLTARFPQVAALQMAMTTENLPKAQLDEALEAACEEIAAQPERIKAVADADGSQDGLLTIALTLQAAVQDVSLLRHLSASIAAATDRAETSVAMLKDIMWAAVVKRPPIDAHVAATADALLAAGLTTPVSRGISVSQLERIAAILSEGAAGRRLVPTTKAVKSPVSVAWRPDNAWATLTREIPGYHYVTRTVSSQDAGLRALVDAGLPPYTDLAKFDLPLPLAAFDAAATNGARAKQCWKLIEKWLRDNHVDGSFDEGVGIRRKKSWVFLFSLVHEFNAGVKEFDAVQFASPWEANKVIMATRQK